MYTKLNTELFFFSNFEDYVKELIDRDYWYMQIIFCKVGLK